MRPVRPPRARLLLTLVALLGVAACAGPRPPAEVPRVPGYEGRIEDLRTRDLGVLTGRRIVLDPGHGGHFRGALGPNGLTEAEVNLGVALHLRGLLEWAGAQVWLTRTADTDFLSPADSTLAHDLAMRVSLSDSLQPDVFISIHHNSTAAMDPTINETQTYYPLDDDGASLDLARAIHRQLVRNLDIRPASIRPGNFHVLRHATVPAVLGEPAMISHPVMAERLSLAASQRLEAEAYFLGLLDSFADGRPRWAGAVRDTARFGGPDDPSRLAWTFVPDGPPGPDPAALALDLDGAPVAARLAPDGRELAWDVPADLPPRPHILAVHGRNLAGRATSRRETVLLPRAAPVPSVRLQAAPDGRLGLQWTGAGGAPLPVGQLSVAPGLTLPVGPDQPNWALVGPLDARPDPAAVRFRPAGRDTVLSCPATLVDLAAGDALHLVSLDGLPHAPARGWRPRRGPTATAPLIAIPRGEALWLEGDGLLPLVDPGPDSPDRSARTVDATAPHWDATALLPALLGRTVVLDPAGGSSADDGTGPLGLRGADLNLATARHAADLLRGAGARVILTRTDETALPPPDKVRLAGRAGADFFLTIARRAPDAPRRALHHPGSAVGAAWATAALAAADRLPAPDGPAPAGERAPSSAYLLRHTACPALEWRFDPPATDAAEWREGQPGWARAEARAILLALADAAGGPTVGTDDLSPAAALAAVAAAGGPAPGTVAWARLDGNYPWSPLPGPAPFPAGADSVTWEQGPPWPAPGQVHLIEVHLIAPPPTAIPGNETDGIGISGADGWSLWRLDRHADAWSARRLDGGPVGRQDLP